MRQVRTNYNYRKQWDVSGKALALFRLAVLPSGFHGQRPQHLFAKARLLRGFSLRQHVKKKPEICLAVRKSSLVNIKLPSSPLAHIIDRATAAGSAFNPVSSPSLNFAVR